MASADINIDEMFGNPRCDIVVYSLAADGDHEVLFFDNNNFTFHEAGGFYTDGGILFPSEDSPSSAEIVAGCLDTNVSNITDYSDDAPEHPLVSMHIQFTLNVAAGGLEPGTYRYDETGKSFTPLAVEQTVSFTSTTPSNAVVGGDSYEVSATATSGLTVDLAVSGSSAAVCSISGSTVNFIGEGTCAITADQPGNPSFSAAPQVQQSFTVNKQSQTVSFDVSVVSGAIIGDSVGMSATATSSLPAQLSVAPASSSVCSLSGSNVSFIGEGTCTINADQPGDTTFAAAPQIQQSFSIDKQTQSISFTHLPFLGGIVGDSTNSITASATSSLSVELTVDSGSSTVCSMSGSTISYLAQGTCTINANQIGDATFSAAPQVQSSFAVFRAKQSISFTSDAPVMAQVNGDVYNVTAEANSQLPVDLSIDGASSSVCSISDTIVSFTGEGSCTINANQPGDAAYTAAPQVQQTIGVGKQTQSVKFTTTAPGYGYIGGGTYDVAASASSGLLVNISIADNSSSICSLSGSNVTFTGEGTCTINADQPGNAAFATASQVQQTIDVGSQSQTISFTSSAPSYGYVGGVAYDVAATASSGLPVNLSIAVASSAVCSLSGSNVTFTGEGTCTINAEQAGNDTFAAADQIQQSIDVGKQSQTISFTSSAPTDASVAGTDYTVAALATSELPVAFNIASASAAICSLSGSTVSFTGEGTCTINAEQAGNSNFTPAQSIQQSFNVQQPPTATFSVVINSDIDGAYSVTSAALPMTLNIPVSAGTGNSGAVELAPGNYAPVISAPANLSLNSSVCTGASSDTSFTQSGSGAIVLQPGESVVCTLSFADTATKTIQQIGQFVQVRADQIVQNGPSSGRRFDRLNGVSSTTGNVNAFGFALGSKAIPLSAKLGSDNASFAFSLRSYRSALKHADEPTFKLSGDIRTLARLLADHTESTISFDAVPTASLGASQNRGHKRRSRRASISSRMGVTADENTQESKKEDLQTPKFDVWTEGFLQRLSVSGSDGYFGVIHSGVDYLVKPNVLMGVALQVDFAELEAGTAKTQGRGYMVGPYVTVKLSENLYFDGRYAWGKAENKTSQSGVSPDRFDSERQLATASLTGQFLWKELLIQPKAELAWFSEKTEEFTNSSSALIPSVETEIGTLTFGPKISKTISADENGIIKAFATVNGIWTFSEKNSQSATTSGIASANNGVRFRLGTGLELQTVDQLGLGFSVYYDGLGDSDYEAYGFSGSIRKRF